MDHIATLKMMMMMMMMMMMITIKIMIVTMSAFPCETCSIALNKCR